MKKIIILFLFASCNSEMDRKVTSSKQDDLDTALLVSFSDSLKDIKNDLAQVLPNIEKLVNERNSLKRQLEETENNYVSAPMKYDLADSTVSIDNRDKIIADLRNRLSQKENEIASLKRQLDYRPQKDAVAIEPDKPNDSSLIVQPIPANNVDIYIIPYSKKARKSLMVYEAACNVSLINKLGGKLSGTYAGQHFFNDLPEGKYIIKFCTYFGNYQVIDKTNEKQIITLITSPPIK